MHRILQTEIVSLDHRYSDSEIAALAREQSESLADIRAMESRLSSFKKDIGARIDEKKAQVALKANRISAGGEWRDVRCLMLDEQPVGYRIGIRCDTAKIVKCRRLRKDERQMELPEGQQALRKVAAAKLDVDCPDMDGEWFEVLFTQEELDALSDAQFTYVEIPEEQTEGHK